MNTNTTVKQFINDLIQAGTTFDTDALEKIYHDDLQILMVGKSGQTSNSNKDATIDLFAQKRANGDPSLNTWAEFHHIDSSASNAHVVLSRKVNLTGEEQKITLSIDLVKPGSDWQVLREVIFIQTQE